ncbi:tetratricopeptide repeat-containing sulfotransferase family protein [Novosphingobium cyanobacteriorum]|uniref:Sulfotransferase n=1 Tax=Novosphingobium cyanobacteriorum TaxID=3024215 RepID=A0ABT6CET4_9SPHN|nr:tetratricopeptide repeat-containing sulfotransferase family protein [Novosphingobium cyanobacteriorum]MDF8332424.1 sulfotransferase [Novosphingobium cyanobacteriorum]
MPIVTQDPLEQAAAALAKDPASAERIARGIVARAPSDPRPRLILASALRRLGRPSDALPILNDLARAYPNAARTRFELGLCLCAIGRGGEGDRQLDEAVRLDPNHAESWRAIEDRAFVAGDAPRELRAQAALARIDAGHPDLGRAAELVVLGRHTEAEPMLQRFCTANPRHAEGFRLMAACHVARRSTASAETLLRHALTLAPDSTRIRFDLAHALYAGRQAGKAIAELQPLLAADPANFAWRNLQAACLGLLGDDAGAEAIHAELAEAFPANARVAVNHGHAARTAGKRDIAIAAYRRATALSPQAGEPWWGLANLKIGVLTDADEAEMRRLLDGRLPDDDRMRLSYALARRLEDAGNVQEAFTHYATGAALARRHFGGEGRDFAAEATRTLDLYTPEFLAARQGSGVDSDAPIFVVGLPRSGSTLVEQILASHPQIEGTMELPYIASIASRIELEGGAERLAAATPAELRGWGEEYLALAQVHRRLGRAKFIDKMPNNFRYIGLIRMILPNARIVDVRRHPMAACFSGFKQLFAEGQEFSYSLDDLAAYYRHYLAIVRHFHATQPGAVHTLVYEDLVESTEAQVRALLDAVGVPFDPATLRFFENDRAVRTVSSEQVRQPIYRSGLDHWRQFEPFLQPLAQGLGPDLSGWRD